jgi:hypothetical protein
MLLKNHQPRAGNAEEESMNSIACVTIAQKRITTTGAAA